MGKILKQYRYYGENSPFNSEDRVNLKGLVSGTTFFKAEDPYISIASLGIQTVPGVKFRINEPTSGNMTKEGIVIGNTGIFQLDLTEGYEISNLRFDKQSLEEYFNLSEKEMDLIGNVRSNAYLIIDIVYITEG